MSQVCNFPSRLLVVQWSPQGLQPSKRLREIAGYPEIVAWTSELRTKKQWALRRGGELKVWEVPLTAQDFDILAKMRAKVEERHVSANSFLILDPAGESMDLCDTTHLRGYGSTTQVGGKERSH